MTDMQFVHTTNCVLLRTSLSVRRSISASYWSAARRKSSCSVRPTRPATLHRPSSISGHKVGTVVSNLPLWQHNQLNRVIVLIVILKHTNANTDWEPEMVSKAEILRLIYQGRFLHCNVTLGALGLPMGKTTVMHLVPRDNLPEPNSQGKGVLWNISSDSWWIYTNMCLYKSAIISIFDVIQ